MPRTLIIGFGNIDRADDGVALFVINALRRRLGQKPLPEDETGLEELGAEVDSAFLSQLTPELLETVAGYRQVIFVDAHVYENVDALHCAPVSPENTPSTFTHHLTPAAFLRCSKPLPSEPVGQLVSIRFPTTFTATSPRKRRPWNRRWNISAIAQTNSLQTRGARSLRSVHLRVAGTPWPYGLRRCFTS
jgi:Ni,Fe-hydrogenase maturation factor